MVITGGCHCGNTTFELGWEPAPDEIPARACGCSFCSKHRGVWTSHPGGVLRVTVADPSLVSSYFFGTRTARFHVCSRCGVVPLVSCLLDGRLYAVVNVNAFDNVAPSLLRPVPVSFDDEGVEARLARRRRNWIADVRFAEGCAAGSD